MRIFADLCFDYSFLYFFHIEQMDYRIKETLAKIEKGISQHISIQDLADSVNVSVPHFQHLFKKNVHISTSKYINDMRLQNARKLLETSHLRIKEIRLKVGATNEAHFIRDFKQKFGQTPTDYRRIFRNKDNEQETTENRQ